jgi:hypothetical protein
LLAPGLGKAPIGSGPKGTGAPQLLAAGWLSAKVVERRPREKRSVPDRQSCGLIGLALLGAIACAWLALAAPAAATLRTHEVRYGAYAIEVPAAWPVYDLAADPRRCVRFDRHAVYLGRPGAEQRCPAHAVGHTEAVLIEPLDRSAMRSRRSDTSSVSGNRVAPRALPRPSSAGMRLAVPSAGVLVTATWRRHAGLVERIVRGARRVPGARLPAGAPASRQRLNRGPVKGRATDSYYTGLGFDACSAPSTNALAAWAVSPYRGLGIYIGGINRGCSQPNLNSTWVASAVAAGWQLIPTYVGLQAPADSCGCASIQPSQAAAQGAAAADDAVTRAAALGIGPGNPVYYDMEAYTRNATNSSAVLTFLRAWTTQLHARGYVSGVYGSAASTISDLVSQYGLGFGSPDNIWIGNWNGLRTTADPYVPASYWSNHQRLHQYRGGHDETYGGVRINIDNDYIDGAVVGNASPPVLPPRRCPKVVFGHRPWSAAFKIRGFNLRYCSKPRRVAAASRPPRFGASGGARNFRKLGFTCRGYRVGRSRVIYKCPGGRAGIIFVRAD